MVSTSPATKAIEQLCDDLLSSGGIHAKSAYIRGDNNTPDEIKICDEFSIQLGGRGEIFVIHTITPGLTRSLGSYKTIVTAMQRIIDSLKG